MANLNEDVLRHIFDFLDTPEDWVRVSQVCKLWKSAASKQWGTITEVSYLSSDVEKKIKPDEKNKVPEISATIAEKMMCYAASSVEVLGASVGSNKTDNNFVYVMFGPFFYKVKSKDFKFVETLDLLAENANCITEIRFDTLPKTELLKQIFELNHITKVAIEDFGHFHGDFSTDEIEELSVGFSDFKDTELFSGHFQNLQKLDLKFNWKFGTDTLDLFLVELSSGCQKLQSVKLAGTRISESELRTLLTLPNLKSLDVETVSSFHTMELLEPLKLSQLRMKYDFVFLNVENFCQALKKMPKLEHLELNVDVQAFLDYYQVFDGDEMFELVSEVIRVAVTQKKDVVLKHSFPAENSRRKKLRISNKSKPSGQESQILNFNVLFNEDNFFLECIKAFVEMNLGSHYPVIDDSEGE